MTDSNTNQPAINFEGQTAIVTGAGRGLGRDYALALAKRGAFVIVNARSENAIGEVVDTILSKGGRAASVSGDVASNDIGDRLAQAAMDITGRVDVLINNAGVVWDKSFLKMEPDIWRSMIDINLNSAYNVTRPILAHMREQSYGRIMLTVSSAALYGNFGQINYSSAKMGLVGFMNTLKQEIKKYDIKVNAVSPSALTNMTEGLYSEKLAELADPQLVTAFVLMLCSRACPVTGHIYRAGLGHFSRVALMTGPGMAFPDEKPTPDKLLASMDTIADMENAVELGSTSESLTFALKHLGLQLDDLMGPR